MAGFRLINGLYVIDKDPFAKLDYGVRMYRWLVPGDLIDATYAPMWQVSDGLIILAQGVIDAGRVAMVKLGGGVIDPLEEAMEWAQCSWRTTQGREEQQTLYFNMVNK